MEPQKVVRKRVVKSSQPSPDLLDPGDLVEYAATVEVKNRKGQGYWPRVGVTTTVRPDETGQEAFDRAVAFVQANLTAQVQEYLK